ncbi:MAG TPA: DUF3563 family protein [Casimicrobiaceae bacterium]|jgi:hypothetical protein|nr:DUF3563 family protein [Casimicrobiaceae bacterium]
MKATGFLCDYPGLAGAWARISQALRFNPSRRFAGQGKARSGGVFDRLDHWFWRQAQRDREAYLAGARDIYELEERIRRLERSGRSGFVA